MFFGVMLVVAGFLLWMQLLIRFAAPGSYRWSGTMGFIDGFRECFKRDQKCRLLGGWENVKECGDLQQSGSECFGNGFSTGGGELEEGDSSVGGMCRPADQVFRLEAIGDGGEIAGREAEFVGQVPHPGGPVAVQRLHDSETRIRKRSLAAAIHPAQERLGEVEGLLDQLPVG
jgi:hypothetical protein